MSVLAAIAILALLIFVHELGHFLAARCQDIYANHFSIGFGPAILRYQGPQTEYALRAIPLGGYVGFPDDDPDSEIDPADPNLLRNRPVLDRAIVMSAGVLANLLFAYAVLASQLVFVGIPSGYDLQPGVIVPQVMGQDSVAARAGIQPGDVILRANDQDFTAFSAPTSGNPSSSEQDSAVKVLVSQIKSNPDQPITLAIQRGQQQLTLQVVPQLGEDGTGRIGVQLAPNGRPVYRRPHSPLEVLRLAAKEFEQILVRTAQGFVTLVTHFSETASQVSGPVKIVEWGASIAQSDSGNLFFFAAFISINLAFINILPLPALDGGQLAFLLIEGIFGKPLPLRLQEGVMQTGLVLLLGLGVFLIVRDTTQLAWVQQFLL